MARLMLMDKGLDMRPDLTLCSTAEMLFVDYNVLAAGPSHKPSTTETAKPLRVIDATVFVVMRSESWVFAAFIRPRVVSALRGAVPDPTKSYEARFGAHPADRQGIRGTAG